jgi:hypothetical protein
MSLIISANDLIVLAIYSKAGGKNGKHSSPSRNLQTYPPCPTSSYRFSNRWSASNFEQYYQRSCTSSVFLQSKKFTLLPSSSTSFLCTPDTARARSAIETGLRISTTDYTRFNILTKQISKIADIIKTLGSRRKNDEDLDVEDVDDD